jgi:membrane-bound serine protease (ClpP class)
MLGKTVNALTPIDAKGGKIFIEGEYWNATSDTSVEKGESVRISAVEGLTVKVEPALPKFLQLEEQIARIPERSV